MTAEKLKAIIADVLKRDVGEIGGESSAEDSDAWDSLSHINVLLALDEALDGKVATIKGIQGARSISSILEMLRQNRLID